MPECCSCCTAFRPRYRKLVDHIFPANPEDGLVKSNMEKLIWYAMHSPDKLDRIGEYLAYRLYRDINRRRTGNVIIAMDALDQLLVACHANSLNLFVESFLQMIQKLLESQEPMLQLRASQSFEKYANIREETPQYHRRYDFFVSKFASMCYYNESDQFKQKQLRTAGIMGLQGVVRKTDWDDLGDNIWQAVHMNKIIPALLFNMQDRMLPVQTEIYEGNEDSSDHEQKVIKKPNELSEICLREIICRATSGKIGNVMHPLLIHMDHHDFWVKNDFAIQTFKIVMYSIQVQNSVTVIKMLIAHLNGKSNASVKWRIGIADVLAQVIPIAAGECIGPSVIDIINSLLEQIRSSIVSEQERVDTSGENALEKMYQETLIHALGEYAKHLPDYQKIESMMFILNKVPGSEHMDDLEKGRSECDVQLQHLLLKSLLKVGTNYKTVQYSTTFTHSFLVRLMRMSMSRDPEIRLTVQQILHTLIDRQDNTSKLLAATIDVGLLKLNTGKMMRQDVNFWKKSGNEILLSVQDNCQFSNNKLANIESLYTTMMLFISEIRHDDVLLDTLRVLFNIQNLAVENDSGKDELSISQRVQLLALVSALMIAISHCITSLKDHIRSVIEKRSSEAPELLPPLQQDYHSSNSLDNLKPELLFDSEAILKILNESDFDARRLTANVSSMMRRPSLFKKQNASLSDIHSFSLDVDSAASSPEIPRKSFEEEVTFDSLKKVLCDNLDPSLKAREERIRQLNEEFMRESFEVLVAKFNEHETLQEKLNKVMNHLPSSQRYQRSNIASSPIVSQPVSSNLNIGTENLSNSTHSFTLNLAPPDAPFQLPYPDIIIY